MIMSAKEQMLSWNDLYSDLKDLRYANDNFDIKKVRRLLIQIVPNFKPQSDIVDIIHD